MPTDEAIAEVESVPPDWVERTLSPAQCRAARGLLDWSQSKLCKLSKVGIRTLGDFERELHTPNHYLLSDIRSALETAGIEFTSWEGGAAGVRFAAGYRSREASNAELKQRAGLPDSSMQGIPAP
jgi:transcriptional regulator with XRE-family HTH domain